MLGVVCPSMFVGDGFPGVLSKFFTEGLVRGEEVEFFCQHCFIEWGEVDGIEIVSGDAGNRLCSRGDDRFFLCHVLEELDWGTVLVAVRDNCDIEGFDHRRDLLVVDRSGKDHLGLDAELGGLLGKVPF